MRSGIFLTVAMKLLTACVESAPTGEAASPAR